MKQHVMLDIETIGVTAGCPVLTIGAAVFDAGGVDDLNTFYERIRLSTCDAIDLKPESDALMWWMQQSDDARKEAFNAEPRIAIDDAITELAEWYKRIGEAPVWCNPPSFDDIILREAANRCGVELPWDGRRLRCFRTVKSIYAHIPVVAPKVKHRADHDAIAQAQTVIAYNKAAEGLILR